MDQQHPEYDGKYASIHAAITQLSVTVGRLDERLHAMDRALIHHTQEEHREFREALALVTQIKTTVDSLASMEDRMATVEDLQSQQKGAWFALAKVSAVILGVAAFISYAFGWFPRK